MIKLEELPEFSIIRVEKPYNKVYLRDDYGWANVETYWDIVFDGDPDGDLVGFEVISLPLTHYIEDGVLKKKEV